MKEYQESDAVGHPGIARTLLLLLRSFDWSSIRKDVIDFILARDLCQRVKASSIKVVRKRYFIYVDCMSQESHQL